MPRPCEKSHKLSPENCRLCYWFVDDSEQGRKYRKIWGGEYPKDDRKEPCRFKGQDVRGPDGKAVTRDCPGFG